LRIDHLDLLAIVIETTLTQTVFRDLKQRHQIVMPNTLLRNQKIEILTKVPTKGLDLFIDYNIGYAINSERIEAFFDEVFTQACKQCAAINAEKKPRICLFNAADHAVTWRFYFTVTSVYKMLQAQYVVNRAAFDLSFKHRLGLNTPITHTKPAVVNWDDLTHQSRSANQEEHT